MSAYWVTHPRRAAAFIVLLALGVPAIDTGRLVDAATESHVVWRTALSVGIVVGVLGIGTIVALYFALRSMGPNAVKYGGYAGAAIAVLVFNTTHPRHGPDAIGSWSMYMVDVAVDTCFALGLIGASILVWRRPVPEVEEAVQDDGRNRHGRRWRRRSAATRPNRPGGR